MIYIYKTTNLINGKNYIGQHKGKPNDSYLGSGTVLNKAIKKYGRENFKKEILEIVSEENVNQKEIFYIEEFKSKGEAQYNISGGGQATSNPFKYKSKKEIEEIKQKMSKTRKGKISGSYLKTWKQKNIKKNTANSNPTNKVKIICLNDNKEFDSISDASNFYNLDKSAVAKVCKNIWSNTKGFKFKYKDDNYKGKETNRGKKVICLNDNKEFNSIIEASKFYNLDKSAVAKVCKGTRHSVGGLMFAFAE